MFLDGFPLVFAQFYLVVVDQLGRIFFGNDYPHPTVGSLFWRIELEGH